MLEINSYTRVLSHVVNCLRQMQVLLQYNLKPTEFDDLKSRLAEGSDEH